MIEAIDLAIIKTAFDTIRAGLGAAKDVKDLAKEGPLKAAAEKKLDEAERATELAQAQIAQALGYKLCKCSFPPQIMLMEGRHTTRGIEIYACPRCQLPIAIRIRVPPNGSE